jgi:hypothetical protein
MNEKRLKYEKPVALDMGAVTPVHGLACDSGNGADTCPHGNNPALQAYCPGGNIADTSCDASGATAGSNCLPTGGIAGQFCATGSAPVLNP